MATTTESIQRNTLATEPEDAMGARTIPILTPTIKMSPSSPTPGGDPMEITTPTSSSAPNNNGNTSSSAPAPAAAAAAKGIERGDLNGAVAANGHSNTNNSQFEQSQSQSQAATSGSMTMPAPAAAAAAVTQPKIVQTAFIHKLYNMLEDPSIQHLISWSASAESFVMSPSQDFSKVLAQYFKHTNISSFVRQLNMYGFHKVSDVFHTGNPESALWEFKHGNGNFKRGDLVGLREIKRRASRHALVHRQDYGNQKATQSQPGTPAEMQPIPDTQDPRLAHFEQTLYDMGARLQRSEENAHFMMVKQQAMMDSVTRLLHFNQELARTMMAVVGPEHHIHRDVLHLQAEIQRQAEMIRSLDDPHESPYPGRQQYFAGLENAPVSPRQLPQDDPRRLNVPRSSNFYRPPVPSSLSISTRRPYGSVAGGTPSQSSPLRSQPAPPPPGPHPLATIEPHQSLARRHTSADIRAHGWQPNPSPFASGHPSGQWPPSPSRVNPEDQRIRDSLSSYSLQVASHSHSRPTTPPPPPFANGNTNGNSNTNGVSSLESWSWGSASRGDKNLAVKDTSAPPTRRGSMAHILNPDNPPDHEMDEDPRGDEDRKRKRLQ